MSTANMEPKVTYAGMLAMQVCVPESWRDEDVLLFANVKNPCGTMNGWAIQQAVDRGLANAPDRVPCAHRQGFVHVTLAA